MNYEWDEKSNALKVFIENEDLMELGTSVEDLVTNRVNPNKLSNYIINNIPITDYFSDYKLYVVIQGSTTDMSGVIAYISNKPLRGMMEEEFEEVPEEVEEDVGIPLPMDREGFDNFMALLKEAMEEEMGIERVRGGERKRRTVPPNGKYACFTFDSLNLVRDACKEANPKRKCRLFKYQDEYYLVLSNNKPEGALEKFGYVTYIDKPRVLFLTEHGIELLKGKPVIESMKKL